MIGLLFYLGIVIANRYENQIDDVLNAIFIIIFSIFIAGLVTRNASDIGKAGSAAMNILNMMEEPS